MPRLCRSRGSQQASKWGQACGKATPGVSEGTAEVKVSRQNCPGLSKVDHGWIRLLLVFQDSDCSHTKAGEVVGRK